MDPSFGFQLYNYFVQKQEFVDMNDKVQALVQVKIDNSRSSRSIHDMEVHNNIVSKIANMSQQTLLGIKSKD